MSVREGCGLLLLAMAFFIAPFAYWLNSKWGLVALAFSLPGFALFLTGRASRKLAERDALDGVAAVGDVLPGVHDVKGFPGAIVLDDVHDGPDHGQPPGQRPNMAFNRTPGYAPSFWRMSAPGAG